jgi:hypothetical protein
LLPPIIKPSVRSIYKGVSNGRLTGQAHS